MFEVITAREPDGSTVRRRVQVLGETGPLLRTRVLDRAWEWGTATDIDGRVTEVLWLIDPACIVRRTRMIEDRLTGAMRRRRKEE